MHVYPIFFSVFLLNFNLLRLCKKYHNPNTTQLVSLIYNVTIYRFICYLQRNISFVNLGWQHLIIFSLQMLYIWYTEDVFGIDYKEEVLMNCIEKLMSVALPCICVANATTITFDEKYKDANNYFKFDVTESKNGYNINWISLENRKYNNSFWRCNY